MKIFVIGATGRVGGYVIQKLEEKGHTVYAASRHPEAITATENIVPVKFDLHDDAKTQAKAMDHMDAVYYVAGSRGHDLLQTDAYGAVKSMEAAEQSYVSRFVMLSSLFSMEPAKWAEEESLRDITNYNIAKFFADQWLMTRTNLCYTIVQPGSLTEDAGTGKITLRPEHSAPNPIPDVAEVLVEVLDRKNTYGQLVPMIGGDTPIADALATI